MRTLTVPVTEGEEEAVEGLDGPEDEDEEDGLDISDRSGHQDGKLTRYSNTPKTHSWVAA